MSATIASPEPRLRQRASAFALLARMLGPDVHALVDDSTIAALRSALLAGGDHAVLERLATLAPSDAVDIDELAGTWVRWFDLGRIAAYEGSNVPPTAAGVTSRLADIAGFYSAFGFAVHHERPDHIVAELEFLAILLLAEADARNGGRPDHAEIAVDAARVFLRDHVGTWVVAWASRVGEIDQLAPWFPVAAAAADLIAAECRDRRVIPLRLNAVLPSDHGMDPSDGGTPECGR